MGIELRKINNYKMKKVFLVFSVMLLISASCRKAQTQNSNPPQPVVQKPATSSPAQMDEDPVLSDFTSSFLGVSFKYNSKAVVVIVDANKIYFDSPSDALKGNHSSGYIEVFAKNINDSLIDAIWKNALAGFSMSQCEVEITKGFQYLNRFTVAHVLATKVQGYNNYMGSCPSDYLDAGAPGQFIYDPSHPNIFLFWSPEGINDARTVIETLQIGK